MIKRVELFDFSFISESSLTPVVDDIIESNSYQQNGKYPFLITPNVDYLINLSKKDNTRLKENLLNSAYILPDGQPIIFASKLFKNKLPARLTGSDLFPLLWNKSKNDFKILALTSAENISDLLQKDNPNAICYALPFFDVMDNTAIERITNECIDILNKEKIKIVMIGISFPKQDILALSIYNKLKNTNATNMPLFCMLGASFEFYLKLKKRAPVFLQNIGFEWLYRFSTEPKRLFKRYFIDSAAFLPIVYKEFFKKT